MVFPFLEGEVVIFTRSSPMAGHDNEDAVGVFEKGGNIGVLAVADGLGGLPQGGDASRQVIEGLSHARIQENINLVIPCLQSVNKSLVSNGSGTTVSVLTVQNRKIRSYHVGDSAVLVAGKRGRVKLETIPHSPVGAALASGYLDEREAMFHRERHVISNMIGMSDMWIDVAKPIQLADLDTAVLASDGLWDNLYQDEVVKLVCTQSLTKAAKGLVQLANDRMKCGSVREPGKPDDLSFILYRPQQSKRAVNANKNVE